MNLYIHIFKKINHVSLSCLNTLNPSYPPLKFGIHQLIPTGSLVLVKKSAQFFVGKLRGPGLVGPHDGQISHADLLDITFLEDAPGSDGKVVQDGAQ